MKEPRFYTLHYSTNFAEFGFGNSKGILPFLERCQFSAKVKISIFYDSKYYLVARFVM
jgi:hypothetical protein